MDLFIAWWSNYDGKGIEKGILGIFDSLELAEGECERYLKDSGDHYDIAYVSKTLINRASSPHLEEAILTFPKVE